MDKFLFYITCTTCQARLKVRDPHAIGIILSCPKCQSMVQVTPPPGWKSPSDDPRPLDSLAPVGADEEIAAPSRGGSVAAVVGPASTVASTAAGPTAPPVVVSAAPPTIAGAAPPSVAASATADAPGDAASDAEFLEAVGAYVARPARFEYPWLLGVGAAAMAVVAGVGLWMVSARSTHRAPPSPAQQVSQVEPPAAPKTNPVPPPLRPEPAPPAPTASQWRWLPERSRLFVDSRLSRWATLPERGRLIDQAGGAWSKSMGAVLGSFGLKLDDVRRLRWAATDLADWPNASVVLIELEQPHDAAELTRSGAPTDLVLAGVACRRHVDGAWTHPYAMLDAQTLITGRAELLRQLSQRPGPALQDKAMGRLLALPAREPAFSLCLDLASARAAGWRLPAAWLDIWPAGRRAWRTLWEEPEALGLSIEPGQAVATELWLSCQTPTVAEKVRAAADEILPEVRKALARRAESITARLQAGALDAATADQYALLLKQAQAVAAAAKPRLVEELVHVEATWEQTPAELSRAALESRAAIAADWFAAARACDEANYGQLLSGLGGFQKTAGSFPAGASGAVLLPAEERLSWIAAMLPYYGQTDWHRRLEFAYPWNGPQNRPVTQRPLEAVVNPALGPSTAEGGFPTTHYVGVAGVGEDAGRVSADDPRAGVFGYGRATRLDQITRGAGNTIAILGVSDRLGPWAAGGPATVRPLTKAPYVNGPDGFGSGQPDGMLAGMADGSVRFLARDIDPHVLEQLATIHGGNGAPLAGLARPSAATAPAAALTPPLKTAGPPDVRAPAASAALPETPALPGPVGPVAAHEPPEVDVATRLTGRIPALEVHNMTLLNLVRLVGDLGGLAITLDMDACQWQGVNVLDPLSVRWEEATLRQVLDAVAAKCGLALLIQGNQVLLTSPREERETLRKVPYTVADLARDEAAGMAGLAALVRELVAPESWKPSGGRGTIAPVGDALVVEQTAAVHAQLLVFCEKLRRARGLALQSRGDPRRFELATRTDRVAVALDRVLSINFHQPAPLPRILAALEVATHAKILVDWVALRAAGLGPAAKVRVSLVEQPAAVVLADLLHPLGLDCYAIDAGLLGVTTRKAIAARWELEFYPVKDLLAAGWTASMLADQIKGSVAKASWNDVGGPGVIRLDEPSAHLIVVQTQPAQSAIARVLTELRRSPAKGQGT